MMSFYVSLAFEKDAGLALLTILTGVCVSY
jgi:hypothetical protein